jgi:hypothetical protein
MLTDFRRRVSLYSEWDVRLGPYTRFFGAAAASMKKNRWVLLE